MNTSSQQIHHAVETITTVNPITYAASATAVTMGGLTSGEWQMAGVIGGLILGVLTFVTNLYYKHKILKLRQNER